MGRPRKYTDLENKILNKCKHKNVQDFLKQNVFGKNFFTCLKCMDMVSIWISEERNESDKEEYKSMWLGTYRYVCEKFKNEDLKLWYPNMDFTTGGYDKDTTWDYEHEYDQQE